MRMKRTGRSRVSAITQTPASGPFALVTTPPMSSLSIRTAALVLGSPPIWDAQAAINAAIPEAINIKASTFVFFIAISLLVIRQYFCLRQTVESEILDAEFSRARSNDVHSGPTISPMDRAAAGISRLLAACLCRLRDGM